MRSPLIFRIFKNNQLVGVKQFDQDQIVVGHNAEVHLDLDSDQVSPIHCLIELRDNGYYVCDLGSSSGTFKNGQAVLDEMISSGDEINIGPFKIVFFVGVPKPKVVPTVAAAAVAPPAAPAEPPIVEYKETPKPPAATPMPPPVAVKVEEVKVAPVVIPVEVPKIEEKPVIARAPVRPEIRHERGQFKKPKKTKTFAPPSEVQDLKRYLKPSKGATLEVVVAWKERVLTTYHYRAGKKVVRINGGAADDISLPQGLAPKNFPLIELTGGVRVNATQDMSVSLVTATGEQSIDDLSRAGKAQRGNIGWNVRVDQGDMVCINMPGGNITIYVRYVPQAPVVPMLPPLMLSGSELMGVVIAIVMVSLLALYISATTPKDWQENKQEDVQRIAQVVFNKPPVAATPVPTPTPTPPPPTPSPTPTPPPPTPSPTPKKVVVADKTQEAQKKGPSTKTETKTQVAARANEVAPKPNAKDRTKRFTSTRQGGAVKTGDTAGANAASSNKDLSKVGLFSAFGGGGNRANIDKAYSGAGEVLGMADKATGTSGFNENRAGDDLGSKFKDAGAGGKGTATQGIAGIGTKGRSSGQSAYGAADGYGSKSTVAIEGGGFEESFDGTIDKEAIRRVIRAKLHEVKSCYERALSVAPKGSSLEGKIVLGWEIVAGGIAKNVKVKSSSLGNAQVENCIRDRLASWTFPDPPPGLTAVVEAYPFVLNKAN